MTPELHNPLIESCPSFLLARWDRSQSELPDNIQELAIQYRIVPAYPALYPHARLLDARLLLRLILLRVTTHFSLVTTTAVAHGLDLITFSPVAFHKHLKRAGPFLANLLSTMLLRDQVYRPERWGGYEVVVCDGTTLSRPGASGTTAHVLYALRLPDLAYVDMVIDPDLTTGETFRYYHPRAGQLWLADQGLCNPPGIAFAIDAQADVVVRFNRYALPLYVAAHSQHPVDVYKLVTQFKKTQHYRSWNLWVRPFHHAPIPGRLVALRLPQEQADKAKEHLRKSHEGPVDPKTLELAGYFMTFTTAPDDRLSDEAVIDLYPLRWQVELQHKRNKSLGGLARLPDFLPETIYTWILGHLIAEYLLQKLAAHLVPAHLALPEASRCLPTGSSTSPVSRPHSGLGTLTPFARHPWHFSAVLWFLLPYLLLPLQQLDFDKFFQRFSAHIERYTTRSSDHYHPKSVERFRLLYTTLIRGPPPH